VAALVASTQERAWQVEQASHQSRARLSHAAVSRLRWAVHALLQLGPALGALRCWREHLWAEATRLQVSAAEHTALANIEDAKEWEAAKREEVQAQHAESETEHRLGLEVPLS
jgi:hypothetical protein